MIASLQTGMCHLQAREMAQAAFQWRAHMKLGARWLLSFAVLYFVISNGLNYFKLSNTHKRKWSGVKWRFLWMFFYFVKKLGFVQCSFPEIGEKHFFCVLLAGSSITSPLCKWRMQTPQLSYSLCIYPASVHLQPPPSIDRSGPTALKWFLGSGRIRIRKQLVLRGEQQNLSVVNASAT